MAVNNKLKLLCVLKIMRGTTAEHRLTQKMIIDKLAAEYGIEAERKSVSSDLATLEEGGFLQSDNKGYFMNQQGYEPYQLKLFADAVCNSCDLSKAEIDATLQLLKKEWSVFALPQDFYSYNPQEKANEGHNGTKINLLLQAMAEDKMITTRVREYGVYEKVLEKGDGEEYRLSPYYLVTSGARYYLLANNVKNDYLSFFTLDKLIRPQILNGEDGREDVPRRKRNEIPELQNNFNVNAFMKKHLNIWGGGEEKKVTLRCQERLQKHIRARFGDCSMFVQFQDGTFQVTVDVNVNEGFFAYIAQMGDTMQIVQPECVREQYFAYLERILGKYGRCIAQDAAKTE